MNWNMDGTNDGALDDIREWERQEKTKEEVLNGEEFYNLMQAYRHSPIAEAVGAYEAVKDFIRREL